MRQSDYSNQTVNRDERKKNKKHIVLPPETKYPLVPDRKKILPNAIDKSQEYSRPAH